MKRLAMKSLAAAVLTLCALPAAAQELLIRNATVHTGASPATLTNTDVLVRGGVIQAIGTALPEVAAAIAAARRGQGDMVVGHVIGSSLFNVLVVIGGMAALRPMPLPASFVRLELPAAIVFVLMLYPMLRGDLKVSRGEGAVLFVAFLAWVGLELALFAV